MPPRILLSSEQRTRLFAIPSDSAEMVRPYMLGGEDLALIRTKRRSVNRLDSTALPVPRRRINMDSTMRLHIAISQKVDHSLREYGAAFAYLYVCFGALLMYKAAILRAHGIDYAPYGLAAGKALLLAKFMLIGRKLRIGSHPRGGTLMHAIVYKSVLFLLLLVGLSAVEEAIVDLIHHRTIDDVLADLGSGRLGQIVAASLLLLLILIPYFAYRELDTALGKGTIFRLLRRAPDGVDAARRS